MGEFEYDVNGDGIDDVIEVTVDADGGILAGADTNADGLIDLATYDVNGDGVFEAAAADTNYDGVADAVFTQGPDGGYVSV